MIEKILLALLVLLPCTSFSQIPVKQIEEKIVQLNSEEEISAYWDTLQSEDQHTLLAIKNKMEYDSMALTQMIKSCFMLKYHGKKGLNLYNFRVPILNHSHNEVPEASFVFWPIIEQCKKFGGAIETFGGAYPAYELEAISLNYYGYSLSNQESKYNSLLNKLTGQDIELIVSKLCSIHQENKKLYELKTKKIIGSWNLQPFQNLKEDGCFELVKMDNNEIYLKKNDRLQKLVFNNRWKRIKIYRIEKEPFGWCYTLSKSGELKLLNDQNEVLIEYTRCV